MTNHWIDMINADVAMVMGSNAAENHPIAMRWIRRAKEHGCFVISCDPRYTRTSSFADIYCPLRSGTDIAFVNGIINYALENNRIQKEYVTNYTNAGFIITEKFSFEDGLFAGWDGKAYDASNWAYELDEATGIPKIDLTLQHPRCVYQLMKAHFGRYDIDTVCNITGSPRDTYEKVCEVFTSTHKPDKVATWLYAMGTTQHTHGTQNIRGYAILQLLMGNVGLAGGGVNALRGESNVQGSTDQGLLFHILTGYLPTPAAEHKDLATFLDKSTPKTKDPKSANWWSNTPKYVVSLLKAYWGDDATSENEFAYHWLPKRSKSHSHMHIFEDMFAGKVKGAFMFGQNPAVAGPNSKLEREALGKLEWMVAVDLWQTETSTFWKRPGVDPATINTEVFLLPAAASVEKEGSISNSGRWVQWRYAGQNPPGDARTDSRIVSDIVMKLKELLPTLDTTGLIEPVTKLTWNYGGEEPDPHMIARELNGYYTKDIEGVGKKGDQVANFTKLFDDGSTACGNWVYSGCYPGPNKTDNMMARRDKHDAINNIGMYPSWSWCWPLNRRIVYNRASVDLQGRPWMPERWVIRWNPALKEGAGAWEGDVPDGGFPPGDKHPFIMRPEGYGCLWATALKEGPFPEHYEPMESPIKNPMSNQQSNPAAVVFKTAGYDDLGDPQDYPVVGTTYRVSEHWQAGAMTRNLPWLAELVPDVFVEIGEDFANRLRVKNGDRVVVSTKRGSMEAYALVTKRWQPFVCDGKRVDQIGILWHFGWEGIATGDSANMLTPHCGDANTAIPEYKAFLCKVERKEV